MNGLIWAAVERRPPGHRLFGREGGVPPPPCFATFIGTIPQRRSLVRFSLPRQLRFMVPISLWSSTVGPRPSTLLHDHMRERGDIGLEIDEDSHQGRQGD